MLLTLLKQVERLAIKTSDFRHKNSSRPKMVMRKSELLRLQNYYRVNIISYMNQVARHLRFVGSGCTMKCVCVPFSYLYIQHII